MSGLQEVIARLKTLDTPAYVTDQDVEDVATLLASQDKLVEGLKDIRRQGLKYNDTGWGSYQDGYVGGLKEASDQAANLLKDIEQ